MNRKAIYIPIIFIIVSFLSNIVWAADQGKINKGRINQDARMKLIDLKQDYYQIITKEWDERAIAAYDAIIEKAKVLKGQYPDTEYANEASRMMIRCYEDTGKEKEAERELKEYLDALDKLSKDKEQSKKYLWRKGFDYYKEKRYQEAIPLFNLLEERYKEDEKMHYQARIYRAVSCFYSGDSLSAFNQLKELYDNPPKDPENHKRIILYYAHVLLTENYQSGAIAAYRKYQELWPKDERNDFVQYQISWAYWAMRDKETALKEFQKVIDNYPDSKYAKIAKKNKKDLNKSFWRVLFGIDELFD